MKKTKKKPKKATPKARFPRPMTVWVYRSTYSSNVVLATTEPGDKDGADGYDDSGESIDICRDVAEALGIPYPTSDQVFQVTLTVTGAYRAETPPIKRAYRPLTPDDYPVDF